MYCRMYNLSRLVSRFSSSSLGSAVVPSRILKGKTGSIIGNDAPVAYKGGLEASFVTGSRFFSTDWGGSIGGNEGNDGWDQAVGGSSGGTASDDLGWDSSSSWSTGLTNEHFDGVVVCKQAADSGEDKHHQSKLVSDMQAYEDIIKEMNKENRKSESFVNSWDERMRETSILLKQVKEPGARGSYLKDSEKAEMYRLHKQNPEVYTVEKLAKDYRIMRQRVHAILWLKELEEEEEKKLGHPLDDSVELLLDACPE